ncbi:MAG: hypothetical protein IJT51_02175 [Bacteroidales bacterium]|nr:hypothetical protein [Bacteroidales bacterium]
MSEEINYKKNFCEKYFDKNCWDLDVLHEVDILLKDNRGHHLLYIEAKFMITNETDHRRALAQTILTNKKQEAILSHVALVYQDLLHNNILELIDCSENDVMYNNDFNWKAERPSNPTKDAVDRINDRIKGHITQYRNDEIKEFYAIFKREQNTTIEITLRNFNVVYNAWKKEVLFQEDIRDEQDIINLFLVDILNGATYKREVIPTQGSIQYQDEIQPLIREGTNLSQYHINYMGENVHGIIYQGSPYSFYYTLADSNRYSFFWRKYRRPPEKNEFMKILEHSATLYSDKYRRDTGGEYTPACFVQKQNEILAQYYNMDEFIVFDPCAGVGNLENQFGKDFKQYCYLSTLEKMDVDICKIKGFENVIRYDYLKPQFDEPRWKHKGYSSTILDICRRENRKLMVIMNPPCQNKKGVANNLAIEFFNRVLKLKPQVIVFYYETKSFFNNEIEHYIKSGYKIVSHIFSNAKETFQLSEWPISQVIFDKDEGDTIDADIIRTKRYELEKDNFIFKGDYTYNFKKPNLFKELQVAIKSNQQGITIGNFSYLNDVIKIGNGGKNRGNYVTIRNLEYCLLSKGLIFNTHHKYFELNSIVYRGKVSDIGKELHNDAIMFSLFYIGFLFSNKGQRNFLMPFKAEELGCGVNDLNAIFEDNIPVVNERPIQYSINFGAEDYQGSDGGAQSGIASENPPEYKAGNMSNRYDSFFDFREFMAQFEFSAEAKSLYAAALQVFRYYHSRPEYADGRDWNDSFYDITNAIMGKNPAADFKGLQKSDDRRIMPVKTTKGTKGFGRHTIRYAVSSESLPIFEQFFDARDVLAQKINRQLVEAGLLLWERENIY